MKGIDPKYMMYLGLLVTIEQAIGHGTVSLTNLVPADWAPYITSWCNFLAFVGTAIMTYQAAASSATPGPLIELPKIPGPNTIVKILMIAFLPLALLAMASRAEAQTAPRLRSPAMTGNIPADIKTDLGIGVQPGSAPALTGNIQVDAKALWDKIQALTKDDLTYAIAKATAAKTNASAVRLQCLQAVADANAQARGDGLIGADGKPLVRPDPALVTGIEDVAELVDNLSPQGKLFTSCAGAAQMFRTNTLAVINSIVTGAVGIAALPAGL